MSLAAVGDGASYEFRWLRWVLLRDTVSARCEDGLTGSRYPRFASIGDALVVSPVRIPADQLAKEIAEIQHALTALPIDALVLGPSTAATLYLGVQFTEPRHLTRAELAQIAPPGSAKDLGEYFSSLCDALLHVCAHPGEHGMIQIIDG
jgi:hypothetical protein